MSKTVTITIGNEPEALGDSATRDDLDNWGEAIAAEVEQRFGVQTLLLWGSSLKLATSDDPEVQEWLNKVCQSDEWMTYLSSPK